jgi:pimeloyl-ACP methyl ester carboxylesterase
MTDMPIARRGVLGAMTLAAGALPLVPAAAHAASASAVDPVWTDGGTVPTLGGRIQWRAAGPADAPPVVLLHKVGGWIADWSKVAGLLAARTRVVAFDFPGHGDSTMAGKPPFVVTVDQNTAAILAALTELRIDRFSVAGNSLGGICAIAMAAMHPERVAKLTVVSASLSSGMTRAKLAEQEATRDATQWTADWRPKWRTIEQVARFASLDPQVEVEQNQSRARADLWVRPSERGVGLTDVPRLLARVQAPTLLLYPDRGHYERYIEVGRQTLPSARIVQVMNTGSFIHQEKPEEVARHMLDFLGASA